MVHMDDRAAKEGALAEGVKVTSVPPRSHIVQGPKGRFLFEGALFSDESFSHEVLGTLNVTKAMELARKRGEKYENIIDRSMVESASETYLDQSTLDSMTVERMNDPVLFITSADGRTYLVDGAHRLHARHKRSIKTVRLYHLPADALPLLQIRVWKLHDDGSRMMVDLTGSVLTTASNGPK